jgi:hypothetical protein
MSKKAFPITVMIPACLHELSLRPAGSGPKALYKRSNRAVGLQLFEKRSCQRHGGRIRNKIQALKVATKMSAELSTSQMPKQDLARAVEPIRDPTIKKIVVAIHGIGDQYRYATARSV